MSKRDVILPVAGTAGAAAGLAAFYAVDTYGPGVQNSVVLNQFGLADTTAAQVSALAAEGAAALEGIGGLALLASIFTNRGPLPKAKNAWGVAARAVAGGAMLWSAFDLLSGYTGHGLLPRGIIQSLGLYDYLGGASNIEHADILSFAAGGATLGAGLAATAFRKPAQARLG